MRLALADTTIRRQGAAVGGLSMVPRTADMVGTGLLAAVIGGSTELAIPRIKSARNKQIRWWMR